MTLVKSELVAIRDAQINDKNFIFASWLRGLYYGDSWYTLVNKTTFMNHYHAVIEGILSQPYTAVKVACLKNDPEVILGYAVMNTTHKAINWVFIKKNWRGIGLAKDLVPADYKTVTNLTRAGLGILKNKNLDFNPFIV